MPKKYKWHKSHRNDDNFVQKLNKANVQLLAVSLEKLKTPKPGYESDSSDCADHDCKIDSH